MDKQRYGTHVNIHEYRERGTLLNTLGPIAIVATGLVLFLNLHIAITVIVILVAVVAMLVGIADCLFATIPGWFRAAEKVVPMKEAPDFIWADASISKHPLYQDALKDYIADSKRGTNRNYWENQFNGLQSTIREINKVRQAREISTRVDYVSIAKEELKLEKGSK